eukprot:3167630-Amphidinium_carterae.2
MKELRGKTVQVTAHRPEWRLFKSTCTVRPRNNPDMRLAQRSPRTRGVQLHSVSLNDRGVPKHVNCQDAVTSGEGLCMCMSMAPFPKVHAAMCPLTHDLQSALRQHMSTLMRLSDSI